MSMKSFSPWVLFAYSGHLLVTVFSCHRPGFTFLFFQSWVGIVLRCFFPCWKRKIEVWNLWRSPAEVTLVGYKILEGHWKRWASWLELCHIDMETLEIRDISAAQKKGNIDTYPCKCWTPKQDASLNLWTSWYFRCSYDTCLRPWTFQTEKKKSFNQYLNVQAATFIPPPQKQNKLICMVGSNGIVDYRDRLVQDRLTRGFVICLFLLTLRTFQL